MKKFVSYLLGGKAATLPMFANLARAQDLSLPQMLLTDQVHLMETGDPKNFCSISNSLQTNVAARILLPAANCSVKTAPDNMTVIVTGLRKGDWVFLAASDALAATPSKEGIRLDFMRNFRVVANYKLNNFEKDFPGYVNGGAIAEGVLYSASIPVDLSVLRNPQGFYLQLIVASADGAFRVSETDKVESVLASCDAYGKSLAGAYCSASPY